MKNLRYAAIVLVALLAISATTLNAQSTGSGFKVPFPFTVAGQTMPAGQYFVEGLWWNAIAFHSAEGKAGLIVIAQKSPRTQETKTKLIFQRYGEHYFLATAELPNMDYGRAFQTTAVSHVIKSAGTVSQVRPEIVEIAGK